MPIILKVKSAIRAGSLAPLIEGVPDHEEARERAVGPGPEEGA